MSEPTNIFSRWSQRKRAVAAAEKKTADAAVSEAKPAEPTQTLPPPQQPAAEPAAFDVSKLPSLESISAQTDIRDFLQPGVPAEIKRAALRRAWVADPAIRDFVGLQENDWDFNDPIAKAGFGPLGPEHNVKELVARVFNNAPTPDARQDATPNKVDPPDQLAPPEEAPGTPSDVTDLDSQSAAERDENIAPQQKNDSPAAKPRRHGGALPG
jgi:hypothetical protein